MVKTSPPRAIRYAKRSVAQGERRNQEGLRQRSEPVGLLQGEVCRAISRARIHQLMNSAFDDKYDRLPHAGDFETKSGIEVVYISPRQIPTGMSPFSARQLYRNAN